MNHNSLFQNVNPCKKTGPAVVSDMSVKGISVTVKVVGETAVDGAGIF